MKALFTLFFSFLFLFSYSQELELEFAQRYGIIENDQSTAVNCVKYYENEDRWLVAGVYNGQVDVGINTTATLSAEEDGNGFVAIYNGDFDLLHHFGTSLGITSAELNADQIITCGRFNTADFDPDSEEDEVFESLSSMGNGYLASYSLEGDFNWSKVFLSENSSNSMLYCKVHSGTIYILGRYSGSQSGGPLTFSNGITDIEVSSEASGSAVLFGYSTLGDYQFHKNYTSDLDLVFPVDFSIFDNTLFISLNIREGEINAGIISEELFNFQEFGNALILGYDLASLSLVEYYSLAPADSESVINFAKFSKTNSQQILITTTSCIGSINVLTHLNSNIQNFSNTSESLYSLVLNVNLEDSSLNQTMFSASEFIELKTCLNLENGDFILSIDYEGEVYNDGVLLENLLVQENSTSALLYLNNPMNGIEMFNINSSFQSDINADILLSPSSGSIIMAGRYQGNHDIDFSSSNVSLGNVSDDQAGFLVKYNFDPTTSIFEESQSTTLLYPNPSESLVSIDISGEGIKNNSKYRIINSIGEIIQQGSTSGKFIDISNLSNGSYILILNHRVLPFIKSPSIQ